MTLEPLKYLIQSVAIERDGDRIVAERVAQVVTVFNAEQAVQAIHEFEQQIEQINREAGNGRVEEGHGLQGGPEPDRRQAGDLEEAGGGHSRRVDAQGVPGR